MTKPVLPSASDEQQLMSRLWSSDIKTNPYNFVMYAFPWGQKGTPLEHFKGPRSWQKEELESMGAHVLMNLERIKNKQEPLVYKSSTSSGRGVGKSSLTAWIVLWMMSCQIGSTTIVTANTEQQLSSRTWAEVGKWHTMMINSHWFDRTALSLRPHQWFERLLKGQLKIDTAYYYAQAQLWSEENPDAFAGAHNHLGILLIFDEASGIPKPIWTVSGGFFTEPVLHRYWLAFSNPRRNTGEFFECFHKNRNFWKKRNIDSRLVEGTDKTELASIVSQHGEDSDEARIEVKGEFPRQGDNQFISRQTVQDAIEREIIDDSYAPLLMGVDIARYGDDKTVFRWRQGRNGKVIPPYELKGADNMKVANEIAHFIDKYKPDAVFIDMGNGTGVIDRLREMGYKIHEVNFGSGADAPQWGNKRVEMWAKMRDWLGGACIDDHQELKDDLVGPQYKFLKSGDKMILESKEEMKRRGLASPDHGDALAVTFALNVARKDNALAKGRRMARVAKDVDYNPFSR